MFGRSPFDFAPQTYHLPRSYPRTIYSDQCLDDYDDLSNYYSRKELSELARRRQLERERQAYLERLAYLQRERQQRQYAQRLAYARAIEERQRLAEEEEEMEREAMMQRLQQQHRSRQTMEARKTLSARDMLKQQLASAARSKQTSPSPSRPSPSQHPARSLVPVCVIGDSLSVDTASSPDNSSVMIEDEPITPDQWNLDSEDVFSFDRIQPSSPSCQ